MMNDYDIQKPFGEKVQFHPNNLVRKQRKSFRSPINPIDLENFKSGLTPHVTGSDICASHSGGVTPVSNRKCLDKDNQRKSSTANTTNRNAPLKSSYSPNFRSKVSVSSKYSNEHDLCSVV